MTRRVRCERTERLLVGRLEEVACSLERPGRCAEGKRLLELASIATLHAVDLHLLTARRADAIWADAAERHPVLRDAAAAQSAPGSRYS